jgi:hypothetical protein
MLCRLFSKSVGFPVRVFFFFPPFTKISNVTLSLPLAAVSYQPNSHFPPITKMGQPQSVQIQSEINPTVAVASSGEEKTAASMVDTTNLNGHKTPTKNEELTLKTISSISSEGHDFVSENDESVTSYDEEVDFDSEEEEDEELEGG